MIHSLTTFSKDKEDKVNSHKNSLKRLHPEDHHPNPQPLFSHKPSLSCSLNNSKGGSLLQYRKLFLVLNNSPCNQSNNNNNNSKLLVLLNNNLSLLRGLHQTKRVNL